MENIKSNLSKNAYPPFLIYKVIRKYLDYKFSRNQNQLKDKSDVHYIKLPYISNFSHHIKNKTSKLCKEFCKENFNIKLVFNSFQIKNYFSNKDPIPNDLKSFLVFKFTCASCSSSYVGGTCRHFKIGLRSISKRITSKHNLWCKNFAFPFYYSSKVGKPYTFRADKSRSIVIIKGRSMNTTPFSVS